MHPMHGYRVPAAPANSERVVPDGIAGGAPLEEIFAALIGLVEEQTRDMRCAILLADETQQRLRIVAAPSVPPDHRAGIESWVQAQARRASGNPAALAREPAYLRGSAADPLRSLWSAPILSRAGLPLGTFAMYYGTPRLPSEYQAGIIDLAVQVARLAIEKHHDGLTRLRGFPGHGTVMTDLVGDVVSADAAFAELLGYKPRQLQGRNIALLAPRENHDELMRRLLALDGTALVTHRVYHARDGRKLALRERWTLRRNAARHARYAGARVEEAMAAEHHPLGRLSARERQVLTLVVAGQTSKQIAVHLRISATSVDTYRSRMMGKLGATHLSGLIRIAIENGLEGSGVRAGFFQERRP